MIYKRALWHLLSDPHPPNKHTHLTRTLGCNVPPGLESKWPAALTTETHQALNSQKFTFKICSHTPVRWRISHPPEQSTFLWLMQKSLQAHCTAYKHCCKNTTVLPSLEVRLCHAFFMEKHLVKLWKQTETHLVQSINTEFKMGCSTQPLPLQILDQYMYL